MPPTTTSFAKKCAALEYGERLSSGRRGNWSAQELLVAATMGGHRAIGWPDAGSIAVGAVADLVTLDLSSPRLAGVDADCHLTEMAAFLPPVRHDVAHVVSSGPGCRARAAIIAWSTTWPPALGSPRWRAVVSS